MLTVFVDGANEPVNPGGHMACAFAAFEGEVSGAEGAQRPPPLAAHYKVFDRHPGATNNVAEYRALRGALGWLIKHAPDAEIKIFMDSNLVVNQVHGSWACRAANLQPFLTECQEQLAKLSKASLHWVRREENAVADSLTRKAYTEKGIKITERHK